MKQVKLPEIVELPSNLVSTIYAFLANCPYAQVCEIMASLETKLLELQIKE